eukprot:3642348-Rhodomonas_salina.2
MGSADLAAKTERHGSSARGGFPSSASPAILSHSSPQRTNLSHFLSPPFFVSPFLSLSLSLASLPPSLYFDCPLPLSRSPFDLRVCVQAPGAGKRTPGNLSAIVLCAHCTMPGTERAYRATMKGSRRYQAETELLGARISKLEREVANTPLASYEFAIRSPVLMPRAVRRLDESSSSSSSSRKRRRRTRQDGSGWRERGGGGCDRGQDAAGGSQTREEEGGGARDRERHVASEGPGSLLS